ncbi:MAG: hypothetical protein JJT77_09295, partial [Crocinitomicaceae bacterium]|nr:hypothetical protein [Crocinitomicaceae bacterium]
KAHFTCLLFFLTFYSLGQEVLMPLGNRFKDSYSIGADTKMHNGLWPATKNNIYGAAENQSLKEEGAWLNRKLFKEHFIILEGEDYFFTIDPLVDLSVGIETGKDTTRLFQNTRAFQVQGEILGKVSFFSSFQENQARFARYRADFYADRGEQLFRQQSQQYDTLNAVVPNGGRTKAFKDDGYDYAASLGYVRYRVNDALAVQIGNQQSFIGHGFRSMLLADNSFYANTLRVDTNPFEKWQYTTMHSQHLNLFRRIRALGDTVFVTSVEEPFERKNFSAKYLTFNPTESLSIGLYEAQVYFREDSIQSQWMHPLFFNPLPFLNTLVFGFENQHAKSLLGINAAWRLNTNHLFYGQFVADEVNVQGFGYQIGWRSLYHLNSAKILLQLEHNQAGSQLYAAKNRRLAFTHFNLPLAHLLGNGFQEYVLRSRVYLGRIYAELEGVFYERNRPITDMRGLFDNRGEYPIAEQSVLFISGEMGFELNPLTKLSVFGRASLRSVDFNFANDARNLIVEVGIQTNIFNRYLSF